VHSDADEKAIVLNNYDWWKDFSLLDFLRDVGKYARVGTMMAKESVKTRLDSEDGMSYTEFTYQLLQGYDFVHLFQVLIQVTPFANAVFFHVSVFDGEFFFVYFILIWEFYLR